MSPFARRTLSRAVYQPECPITSRYKPVSSPVTWWAITVTKAWPPGSEPYHCVQGRAPILVSKRVVLVDPLFAGVAISPRRPVGAPATGRDSSIATISRPILRCLRRNSADGSPGMSRRACQFESERSHSTVTDKNAGLEIEIGQRHRMAGSALEAGPAIAT